MVNGVTACLEAGRLLLFYLKNQVENANNNEAKLKQFAVCNGHIVIPPLMSEGAEAPSLVGGTDRLLPFSPFPARQRLSHSLMGAVLFYTMR